MPKVAPSLLSIALLLLAHPLSSLAQELNRSPVSNVGDAVISGSSGIVLSDQTTSGRLIGGSIRGTDCDEAAVLDAKGAPIFPAGATEIGQPVDVDEDRGTLSSLYPSLDTTTDGFYPLPCEPSIGGTLPAAVNAPPSQDELDVERYLNDFEVTTVPGIVDRLKLGTMRDLGLPQIDEFKVGGCFIRYYWTPAGTDYPVPCDSAGFLLSNQPFEGRDIIFVHGLATGHFRKWIGGDARARTFWRGAQDAGAPEYLDSGGYFRNYAKDYWADHIREHLFDAEEPSNTATGWQWLPGESSASYHPKSNRYLLVAWSSNQTIEYAQHALLTQIQLAITSNKNVVTPPNYPSNFVRPFCSNGCIIIGHSTGPLVTSSAMSLAKAGVFGPGGKQIPGHIRAHVSFAGALSGSRLATAGVGIALQSNPVPPLLCSAVYDLLGMPCSGVSFLANSILRDLIPRVAQDVWGFPVATTPIPTVTVAGGHPLGKGWGILRPFLPGLDDGVVTMNSACGNSNRVTPFVLAPSGAIVTSLVKAFDFSEHGGKLARAVQNFVSHKNLMGPLILPMHPLFLASACTPYRSPTGMVMPVASPGVGGPWDARSRYPNHYSFIQASLSHSYDGGSEADSSNAWPSSVGLPAGTPRHYLNFATDNVEETSAITDGAIYAAAADGTYLVKPTFANEMHEVIRGRKLGFKLPWPLPYNSNRCPDRWCTWWIWKRTYHLLEPGKFKQSSHYVYEFVARR